MKKAWQLDRELRVNAIPVDRRLVNRNYLENVNGEHFLNNMLLALWNTQVPGSGAPEVAYVSMVAAMEGKGYDVTRAEKVLEEGLALYDRGAFEELTPKTHELIRVLYESPLDPAHPYHLYEHPQTWEAVRQAMHPAASEARQPFDLHNLQARIQDGWVGQLAGGSFGTAIEGYTGEAITRVYGTIEDYVTKPETTNDDVVYELVYLDAFERLGAEVSSLELGREWVKQIPFGWSAELVALENMKKGIWPPESGSQNNAYSDWLGVQMRTMIYGMLAPGRPMEATRLAYIDGVVSHSANGVYGGLYAAAATSLAFSCRDPRRILEESLQYVPQKSEFAAVVRFCLDVVKNHDPQSAWKILDEQYQRYNWIHAYPNIAADILSLWYCEGDMTRAFSLLAQAGLDVDCNAGLVGNVLGVMNGVPARWADPIKNDDLLETYLPAHPRMSIRQLAERTYQAALRMQ